jgi:hypothetical protein
MQITHSLTVQDDAELVELLGCVVAGDARVTGILVNLKEGQAELEGAAAAATDAAIGGLSECWEAKKRGKGLDGAEKDPKSVPNGLASKFLEPPPNNGIPRGAAPPVGPKNAVGLSPNGARLEGPFHNLL